MEEKIIDHEELLKEKLLVLKKNLDAVGREALKTKYANAYKKLLGEINDLSNQVIRQKVFILDLALVSDEARPKFAEIFNAHHNDIKKHLLNADFDAYMSALEETYKEYAKLWCDSVVRYYKEGDIPIWNPFCLQPTTTSFDSEKGTSEATEVVA